MSSSDYRQFGLCRKTILNAGDPFVLPTGCTSAVVKSLVDTTSLTGVTLQFEVDPATYAVALKTGAELIGVKAMTVAAGQVECFFFGT
jgi:hypothetical protein